MNRLYIFLFAFILFSCKQEEQQEQTRTNVNLSPSLVESINRGKGIYNNYCASCHLTSGKGIPNAFPPLDNSNWLKNKREESIRAVKFGLRGPIEVNGEKYNSVMLDLGLSDKEVADVMNYINNSWSNNNQPEVTVEEVEQIKK